MSWREHADLAQEVILETMAERGPDGAFDVVYEPGQGGTARPVRGIFRDRHLEKTLEPLTAPVSVWEPKLGVKIADLAPDWPLHPSARFVIPRPPGGDPQDRALLFRYEVVDRQLDGEGMVELLLRRKDD